VDVSWQDFAPVVRTIQVLDVAVHGILWQEDKWAIDLAAFPNLLLLRLSLPQPVPRMALATLSTIIPTNRIRTIVISIMSGTDTLDEVGCTQLAATLSTLPMTNSPTVEFEMDFDLHAAALKIFGGLNSGEPVRRVFHYLNRSSHRYCICSFLLLRRQKRRGGGYFSPLLLTVHFSLTSIPPECHRRLLMRCYCLITASCFVSSHSFLSTQF
jgi:hypothetical protein